MIYKTALVTLFFVLGLLFLDKLVSLGALVPILVIAGMVASFVAAIALITEKQ